MTEKTLLKKKLATTGALVVAAGIVLSGCSTGAATEDVADASTITVTTNLGEVEVPVEPLRVAALDNTSFATLKALGVEPIAVPKPLLPGEGFDDWADDADVFDAGSHREPDLEAISEAEPDLIIGGYRFADYTDDLGKIATVIDIAPSEEAEGGYVESLKHQTEVLGEIFNKQDEASDIVSALEKATDAAAAATNGETVFLANSSGGKLDNGAGRIGRILEPLNLTDVFASESLDSDSVHNDSGLSPETIAQANPDWVIVLDRDAAVADGEFAPAKQLIEAQEAWVNTTFMTNDQVIYLDRFFYVTEGIQAYTTTYEQIATAFAAA